MGSITMRGDNTYRLYVSLGSDSNGKPVRKTKTIHVSSKREAGLELAKFELECQRDRLKNTKECTIGEFTQIWWKEHIDGFSRISTKRGYKTALYYHIVPRFGDVKLRNLKPLMIQKWINEMDGNGLSAKTIKNYVSVLNSMYEYAIKWEYAEHNPVKKTDLPRKKRTESRYYNQDEVEQLLKALDTTTDAEMNYKVAVLIGLFAGLRKGEILGLDVDDYNSEKGTLRVIRTRMIAEGIGPYEDDPKTEKSVRVVSIPRELCNEIDKLLEYHKEQKQFLLNKWNCSPALIKGTFGGPLYPQNLQRWFSKFIKANELPHLTLHGLRHTHTAMVASITDDVAQISARLGHSQISTTMNIYTHLFNDSDRTLADKISEHFMK